MRSSLLARGLLVGLALSFLAVPAAFADDPGTTTETSTTTDTATTTETTTTTTTTETSTTGTETAPAETEAAPDPWAETPETLRLRARTIHYRTVARRWKALMGKPRPRVAAPTMAFESLLERRRWWARKWRNKALAARQRGHRPPHLRAWICIHGYEGSWRDPNAPYYGGLQMDLTFQRQYGRRLLRHKGTADHWTRLEQMWVAERAHRSGRGFYPWPLTARRCGLI
jgi:hypothetical protein